VFTADRSTKEEPCYTPVASPRLPRSTSPWPPGSRTQDHPGVPPNPTVEGAHHTRPASARFRVGYISRGVRTQVPLVLLSVALTGPAPSGSADTSRPCQGCSHPPRHLPDQAALSSTALLRQGQRRRSLTSTRYSSASRRTGPRCDVRRGPLPGTHRQRPPGNGHPAQHSHQPPTTRRPPQHRCRTTTSRHKPIQTHQPATDLVKQDFASALGSTSSGVASEDRVSGTCTPSLPIDQSVRSRRRCVP